VPFLLYTALVPVLGRGRIDRLGSRAREASGDLNAHVVDTVQGLAEIVAYRRVDAWGEALTVKARRFFDLRLPFLRDLALQTAFQETATGLGGLAVIGVGAWLVHQGQLDAGTLPLMTLLALSAFVPLWEVSLGHSKAYGNQLLTLMLLAGGLGTLAAGPLADRMGRRPVLIGSIAATAPLTLVFVTVGGVAGAAALALVGACVVGTFGVTMVMSQEYLPQQIGLASGLSIGMSIGLGGVAAVALGALADTVDLRTSLYVCAAVPVAAVALAAFLPSSRATRRLAPEAIQT